MDDPFLAEPLLAAVLTTPAVTEIGKVVCAVAPPASTAVTVAVKLPVAVGAPDSRPEGETVTPAGRPLTE